MSFTRSLFMLERTGARPANRIANTVRGRLISLLLLPPVHLRLHDDVDRPIGQDADDPQGEVEDDLRIVPDELRRADGEEKDEKRNDVNSPIHPLILTKPRT